MAHKVCPYCSLPVTLSPSAADRAKKYGGSAQDYIDLFPSHSDCMVRARTQSAIEAMRKAAQK